MSLGPRLVIVSGLSGAGRTTAMKALEDLGFYCVDNLPVVLLEPFVELFREGSDRLAVAVDVRERAFLSKFPEVHAHLRRSGLATTLLYMEASDEVLAQRFSETRRVHPARGSGSLFEDISRERELLVPIARLADLVVDTGQMSVHDLKRQISRHFTGSERKAGMEIELVSFGYRHGAPEAADLMIDVRFLPNPNFEPGLRARTGLEPDVAAFVLDSPHTREFMTRLCEFLDFLIPRYEQEGKARLTVALGCTGGQHRSVAVACALDRHLRERKIDVRVTHRDVARARRSEP
ncbi:MAG: RNase adapter RapZ [Myxococcota bacterium]